MREIVMTDSYGMNWGFHLMDREEKPLEMTVYACYVNGTTNIAYMYTVDRDLAEYYISRSDGSRYEECVVSVHDWVRLANNGN